MSRKLVTNSTEYFSYSRRVGAQTSATENSEKPAAKGLKIENLKVEKRSISTYVPSSAAVIPGYERLQLAERNRMVEINENSDDIDSCNISNISSSSQQEN